MKKPKVQTVIDVCPFCHCSETCGYTKNGKFHCHIADKDGCPSLERLKAKGKK